MKRKATDSAGLQKSKQSGFTMLEIMAVVTMIGILATYAGYNALAEHKLAKRTEAKLALDSLRDAQRAHYVEHGYYAGTFDELTFLVEGAVQPSPTKMQAPRYTYVLTQPQGKQSYEVTCTGQLDSDEFPDVLLMTVVRQ